MYIDIYGYKEEYLSKEQNWPSSNQFGIYYK